MKKTAHVVDFDNRLVWNNAVLCRLSEPYLNPVDGVEYEYVIVSMTDRALFLGGFGPETMIFGSNSEFKKVCSFGLASIREKDRAKCMRLLGYELVSTFYVATAKGNVHGTLRAVCAWQAEMQGAYARVGIVGYTADEVDVEDVDFDPEDLDKAVQIVASRLGVAP